MGDSDDEFDRKKGRDKFRRERNDYEGGRRSDDRRRDNWEDRRPAMRGGQRGWRGNSGGGMRSRDHWQGGRGGGGGMRDRRDNWNQRPYDDRRRERFSPGRYDGGPPHKRMRRDWDDGGGGYGMYESPFQVSNGPPGSDRGGWQPRGMEVSNGPPGDRGGPGGFPDRSVIDPEHPSQPAMMTFKQFLQKQDDTISQEDAIKAFEDYKLDFKRQQINEFFLQHKEEEWFKSKYHPEECDKRQVELRSALESRRKVFVALREKKFLDEVCVDSGSTDSLVKIMDAAVILLEGGNDLDLTILDAPPEEPEDRKRENSESAASPSKSERKDKSDGEDGELSDSNERKRKKRSDESGELSEDGELSDANEHKDDKSKHEDDDDKDKGTEKKPENKTAPKDLSLAISPEQEELKRKAMEYQRQQEAAAEEAKAQRRKKKNMRKKSDYSYESDSDSDSESDSDPEPAPPGLEDDPAPPGVEENKANDNKDKEPPVDKTDDKVEKTNGLEPTQEDNKVKEEEKEEDKPRPLHRTNSIFLRNLAPTITKQEVEAMCRRFPGFIRVALQDPQPERRFMRRGWVTFSKTCNIKEVCWNLSNIRLRDCELGATLNRQLQLRVRSANGLTVHKQVMRNDIKMAAKVIQILDKKWGLWEEEGQEKKDEEKEPQFGFVSRNPVLKNITDFLVEEGSYEEEELIGSTADEKKEEDSEISIERDPCLCQALDRMILYLRLVHSIDYYAANEYPNEDEMPHRCGIMHARGEPPGASAKITQTDVTEFMAGFEKKIKPFMEAEHKINDVEASKLGRKDPESEVEKFVQSNTQELSRDKWLCPLSGKKFKGPEFVRKHIFNKHGEKIEEVKKEVKYFNNYLVDPKRPALPEHPSSRPKPPPPANATPTPTPPQQRDTYAAYTSPLGVYTQGRPPYSGGPGYQSPFTVRDTRPPPGDFRRSGPTRPYRRSDPRPIINYTDLDAPEDGDIF